MDKLKKFIIDNNLGTIIENGLFANITTLRVGGKIKLLFYPNSYDNFITFYRYFIRNNEINDMLIIGNGSNILASDNDYDGIVVCFKYIEKDIEECLIENKYIISAYSGTSLHVLSKYTMDKGLLGGEFLYFIPGLVGGAVCMNASCYDSEISKIIYRVLCLDEKGNLKWYTKDELKYGYRDSLIKNSKLIVIKAEFEFVKIDDKEIIINRFNEYKRKKASSQPIGNFSAGSVFKNKKNKSAWQIVEELGYKGSCLGGCLVSNKHSNFIINRGDARASDAYNLMNKIKDAYKKEYNDNLECEWILVNFNE